MGNCQNQKTYSIYNILAFLAPACIGTFVFVIIPIVLSFGISFLSWDFLSLPKFAGINNYLEIFTKPEYIKIFYNTLVYSFSVTLFGVTLPLIIAYMIFLQFKFSEEFKLILFLPYIIPMVVVGSVWCWIFDPSSGLVNNLLHLECKWLYDENLAMGILIFVSVWKLLGYNVVLYLTGFAGINKSFIEAAKVDGAGEWYILYKIILPNIMPIIVFVASVTLISSFQVFDLIYIMTQGGPEHATDVLVYSVYREGFEYFEAGKSSALGYILFFMLIIVNLIAFAFQRICKKA